MEQTNMSEFDTTRSDICKYNAPNLIMDLYILSLTSNFIYIVQELYEIWTGTYDHKYKIEIQKNLRETNDFDRFRNVMKESYDGKSSFIDTVQIW